MLDWIVQQANACCGEFIERIPLSVLAALVLGPALILGGWALQRIIRSAERG